MNPSSETVRLTDNTEPDADSLQDQTFKPRKFAPNELEELATSQLEHALDARRRGLKIYESVKTLNEIVGTQYGDRVLFELVQNAHDAHRPNEKGEIAIKLVGDGSQGTLFVANRGRSFTFSNLDSIRNIGTSDKEVGEGIGNKGLGFRSVEALTDDPRIYSQDAANVGNRFSGYCFRFATETEIEERLGRFGAPAHIRRQVATNISRYLVPLPLDNQSNEVLKFAEAGFATLVEIPLRSAEAVKLAYNQVATLASPNAPILLFLERLSVLDIQAHVGSETPINRRLTRHTSEIDTPAEPTTVTLHRVELDQGDPFLVVRRVLPKEEVIDAVRESISAAPALNRWLEWKGDAVVSIAVGLRDDGVTSARFFNFLPMDETAVAPLHGYLDAPFFADIDRRSMKVELPLNRYLLEAAAEACATAALTSVRHNLPVPETSIIDLVTWGRPHVDKITKAFSGLGEEFTSAAIWPVVADGESDWASLDYLYAWPDVVTKILKPRYLAKIAGAAILSDQLGPDRLSRVRRIAAEVSKPVELNASVLCDWVVTAADALMESKRSRVRQWRDFYDDVVAVFEESSIDLTELQGKQFLKSNEGQLIEASNPGAAGAAPVFVRPLGSKGRRRAGAPMPPSALSRRFKFFDDQIHLSEETLRSFEKASLVRRYDAVEVLSDLAAVIGKRSTANQRREALTWAFRVWLATGGQAVEVALRKAHLFVPTVSGWSPATDAFFSSSWTNIGKWLEPYLAEAAEYSEDCAHQRDRMLADYSKWPLASSQDKKSDWLRFLGILSVRDGLHPIAGKIGRRGTPTSYWHNLFRTGNAKLGLDNAWVALAQANHLSYPQTEYLLEGECWRLPGQLEHELLPEAAKEIFSDLIIAFLKEWGDDHFGFVVRHWRGYESANLPTPLQIFLREGEWMLSYRRDEPLFRRPRETWATQVARQVPPRFVERFAAEPGHRGSAPPLLFDARVGLRDWTAPQTAPERLRALAGALIDLSAAERRDLRDQLRRAWADIADGDCALPNDVELVVERSGSLEVVKSDPEAPPVVHLTSERQGFAARALSDEGAAVLDLGVADTATICNLLERTGGFIPRPVDPGDVRLVVDGVDFQPERSDPFLVSGEMNWLSDAAVLAHEFLGDPLELRTLPPETLEQRIRLIRVKFCRSFALIIGDHQVSAPGQERVQPFPHSRMPTLVVARTDEIDVDFLVEAAPAITKLVGARRNTLETMLTRLIRYGFRGSEAGPTNEQYGRAIQREVAIVRDHFAATQGGLDRRVRTLLPIVYYIAGDDVARQLSEAYSKLGPLLHLRKWLDENLGESSAEAVWTAVDETDDQASLRRRLGFDFSKYNAILADLGYPVLNDEEDFRRLFEVYLNELRPHLVDRVRRRYFETFRKGESLDGYVEHRKLDFVLFDPAWPLTIEELDRSFIERYASEMAESVLGRDDYTIELPDLRRLSAANQRLALATQPRMANLVRAWCRKNSQERPPLMDPADAQPLVKALEQAGLFDFERLLPEQLPALCNRIRAWPRGMAETLELTELSLTEEDLDFEEREAREARRRAEIDRRSVMFGGTSLDTGAPSFAQEFANLADRALSSGTEWLTRSRPPRLEIQEQPEGAHGGRKGGGGSVKSRRRGDQPPEPIRRAMGIASEYLAREYLLQRHPREMTDRCWVSENRSFFCSDGQTGDDSLGYDFRVVTARNEWLYEVKSALDEGGEFELTARELEIAGSAARDRKRRYRILYVPFVFDPARWRVLMLQNPVGETTRNRFKVIRTGSVRYGFDIK
ncbi:MAG: DUF3883 domain-containing protein [Rhodospirillales bacterium]